DGGHVIPKQESLEDTMRKPEAEDADLKRMLEECLKGRRGPGGRSPRVADSRARYHSRRKEEKGRKGKREK
ncbi:MAG: hypothetical protein JRM80_13135, partial [Nitrososphaerota archaeon]|nr:hypothetical protein [Nitrososphaerota archaeon]